MSYAIQKGLIKPHQQRSAYGEIWWPITSRLAECPPMQDAYDDFLAVREKKKACNICILPFSKACKCRKKYEDQMESLERKGDAAWKRCKVEKKRVEIADEAAVDVIPIGPVPDYLVQGSTYVDPAVNYDYSMQSGAGAGAGSDSTDDSDDIAEQNKKLMMYAGGAAAVLLLIVMMRRK